MKKLLKFCLVGISNSLISFCFFYFLAEILSINYLVSSFIGYVFGVLNSYILNKKWTFDNREENIFPQLIKFTVVNVVSLGVNLLVMYIGVEILHLVKALSQLLAMIFTTIVNFSGSRLWVFAVIDAPEDEDISLNTIAAIRKTAKE